MYIYNYNLATALSSNFITRLCCRQVIVIITLPPGAVRSFAIFVSVRLCIHIINHLCTYVHTSIKPSYQFVLPK